MRNSYIGTESYVNSRRFTKKKCKIRFNNICVSRIFSLPHKSIQISHYMRIAAILCRASLRCVSAMLKFPQLFNYVRTELYCETVILYEDYLYSSVSYFSLQISEETIFLLTIFCKKISDQMLTHFHYYAMIILSNKN